MKFTVLGNLRHNGVDYKSGDIVEINESEQYKPLIELKIIAKDKSEKKADNKENK